jgi:hypothetical protein
MQGRGASRAAKKSAANPSRSARLSDRNNSRGSKFAAQEHLLRFFKYSAEFQEKIAEQKLSQPAHDTACGATNIPRNGLNPIVAAQILAIVNLKFQQSHNITH